jgi:outer membrane receptor protein involved in Fe transport
LSRASLYGGDAYAEIRLREGVATFGTVTYVRGINHDPRPLVGDPNKPAEPLPGIYPLNGSIGIRFFDQQQDRWGVTFLTRMVHGQDVVADSLAELPTAGYTTLDLLGYYRVNNRLRLTAAILNVTDRLYTQHGSLLLVNRVGDASFVKDPGINARFGLELSF